MYAWLDYKELFPRSIKFFLEARYDKRVTAIGATIMPVDSTFELELIEARNSKENIHPAMTHACAVR